MAHFTNQEVPMRTGTFLSCAFLLFQPVICSASGIGPQRELVISRSAVERRVMAGYYSATSYAQLSYGSTGLYLARLGRPFSWNERGGAELGDRYTIVPMVELRTNPTTGRSGGLLVIRGEYAPTSLVSQASGPAGMTFIVENSLMWQPRFPTIMTIKLQMEMGLWMGGRGSTVGLDNLFIVVPGIVMGRPRKAPMYQDDPGIVRGMSEGLVLRQHSIYWRRCLGPGLSQISMLPPSVNHQGPTVQLSYSYRW